MLLVNITQYNIQRLFCATHSPDRHRATDFFFFVTAFFLLQTTKPLPLKQIMLTTIILFQLTLAWAHTQTCAGTYTQRFDDFVSSEEVCIYLFIYKKKNLGLCNHVVISYIS